MLTSIEVASPSAREVLVLPLEESEDPLQRNNYYVESVDGIDPVKASFSSNEMAHADGIFIQNSRLDSRNLVFTIKPNPDYVDNTVQALRGNLYRYFMPKNNVTIRFIDDTFVAREITGVVESFETPIFAKEPTFSISVICPNPEFFSVEESTETFQTTALSERTELVYLGSAPTGVVLRMLVKEPISDFKFEVQSENGIIQRFNYNGYIPVNNAIVVDTNYRKRRVHLVTGSKSKSVLYNVGLQSTWPQLHPGSNLIRVYTVAAAQTYTLTYTNKFGGL